MILRDFTSHLLIEQLAGVPGVARGIKKNVLPMLSPGYPWVPSKHVSPLGPVVWPVIGHKYTNVLFYYIAYVPCGFFILRDNCRFLRQKQWKTFLDFNNFQAR